MELCPSENFMTVSPFLQADVLGHGQKDRGKDSSLPSVLSFTEIPPFAYQLFVLKDNPLKCKCLLQGSRFSQGSAKYSHKSNIVDHLFVYNYELKNGLYSLNG